jgi:thiol-disulfide isomerase/thioredoxin
MVARWLAVALLALAAACSGAPDGTTAGAACAVNPKKANLSFTLSGLDGRGVRLADYQGKVVFLNFWATWCVPCQAEIPILIELQEKYRDQGLDVVGVVALDDFAKAGPYAEKAGMNYTILDGTTRADVEEAYGPLAGLPSSFLIARDGSVCFEHLGVPRPRPDEALPDAIRRTFEAEIKALL